MCKSKGLGLTVNTVLIRLGKILLMMMNSKLILFDYSNELAYFCLKETIHNYIVHVWHCSTVCDNEWSCVHCILSVFNIQYCIENDLLNCVYSGTWQAVFRWGFHLVGPPLNFIIDHTIESGIIKQILHVTNTFRHKICCIRTFGSYNILYPIAFFSLV